MEYTEVKVGISDLNVVLPPQKIITIGLGSCVGIGLYDADSKVAGLAHIMLPDSTQFRNVTQPLKFADLAIPILIEKMVSKGCKRKNIVAKIAGGASMFNFSDKNMISDIGKRNTEAVKQSLKSHEIPIVAEETGGNKGRTMILESEDGAVTIKSIGNSLRRL